MALNVTTAVIGSGCNTATASPSLAQWDQGQVLKIEGVDLPSAYQVEFSTEYTRNAIPQIGNADGVAIPNELLQRSAPITAYIVLHEGLNDREREYWITIYITPGTPPETITPDPEQMDVIDETIAALQAGVAAAEAAAEEAERQVGISEEHAEDSEAWAVGERGGVPVDPDDDTYHNNAKWYSGQADSISRGNATLAESWAVGGTGTRPGEDNDNAKHYAIVAQQGAEESGFAWFDVNDQDGEMYVTITPNLAEDVSFSVDESNGILEVVVNG